MDTSGGNYSAPPQLPPQEAHLNKPITLKPPHDMREQDARMYRDMVKQVFADRPQVYNDFIDTMRKFKSQEITTPDVIEHVRHLFRGYPLLIQGFNAFLPDEVGTFFSFINCMTIVAVFDCILNAYLFF
jgi:histone deacetylase complex regulatory component SIN3